MNPEAFKITVLPMKHKLFRLAFRLLQDREEAEDVVQDTMVKLWVKRDEIVHYTSVEAFAVTMVKNISLDRIRSKSFQTERLNGQRVDNLPEDSGDAFERSDFSGFVKKIIDRLPEQQKLIMHMRDVEEMEYERIAEVLQTNVNAVRVNLSRARKQVRDMILKIQGYELARN